MPKMKTHKGAAKRFRKRSSGQIKRGKAFRRHILTSKTRSRKRHLRAIGVVHATNQDSIEKLLPY